MPAKRNPKYDSAYALYLTGLSLEQVAAKLGVTRQAMFKAFKKRGFTLRGPAFQPEQEFDGKKFTLRANGYYGLTTNARTLMHRYVWSFSNGSIPAGHEIHHRDFDKANNRLENLECLAKSEHTRLYSPHNNQFTAGRKIPGKCKS